MPLQVQKSPERNRGQSQRPLIVRTPTLFLGRYFRESLNKLNRKMGLARGGYTLVTML